MGYISGNASTQGNLFATALCLTASHPSPPTAFLCLLLLVYCKPPFNILSHVVRLAPGLRSFSVFLLPPSRPPSLPPSLPLTPLLCLRWPHFDQGNLSTATHLECRS
ncbi:uncharacterized protein K444DRAFT_437373 [Hyaloscypha bicolor E]|uniref:Uncharacterized protein n=1 Tax=Hyaloscypha bicolor E TaxID=1095630 RepID=A0A2J6T537_9HELO|nr:uncharacterized protein K444DRAFT_437373 [Hyaloscypha bicolor E]PMD58140.1 hypothetical protein K444DRAFT_437373 [Hyaloscypha bicolor E]